MDTEFKIGDIVKAPNTIFGEDTTLYVCHIEKHTFVTLLYVSDNPNADKSECEKTFDEDTILVKRKSTDWISVKDRLPKPISTVLIWTTISIEPTLGYYVNDWLYFSPNGNFWIKKEPHIEVLYWMELPNPPKEINFSNSQED